MNKIPFHPLAEIFPLMEGEGFEAMVKDIRDHGLHEPITLHEDKILDGRNRYRACVKAGVEPAFVPFRGADAASYVVSANIHRRHLTAEQKRKVIADLVKAQPEKSDRQIAATVKVDHKTVGSVRAEVKGRGEIPHVETRTDTKGRKQPTKKKPPKLQQRKQNAALTPLGALPDNSAESINPIFAAWEKASATQRREFVSMCRHELTSFQQEQDRASPENVADSIRESGGSSGKKKGRKQTPRVVTVTIAEAVSEAFGEIADLAYECRDVVENAPPGLNETQRIQTLGETADTLESLDEPEIPEALSSIEVSWPVGTKKSRQSRAGRMGHALTIIQAVVEVLDEIAEDDTRYADAHTLREQLDDKVSDGEACDFPGMYS